MAAEPVVRDYHEITADHAAVAWECASTVFPDDITDQELFTAGFNAAVVSAVTVRLADRIEQNVAGYLLSIVRMEINKHGKAIIKSGERTAAAIDAGDAAGVAALRTATARYRAKQLFRYAVHRALRTASPSTPVKPRSPDSELGVALREVMTRDDSMAVLASVFRSLDDEQFRVLSFAIVSASEWKRDLCDE